MKHLIRIVTAALVVGVYGASVASAQTQNSISVPAAQRALSSIETKMMELAQKKGGKADYHPLEKAFCAAIPRGSVSGWVGKVVDMGINEVEMGQENGFTGSAPEGSFLMLNVATEGSHELALGNFYWSAVTYSTTEPHPPTIFPVGSPLNTMRLGLRAGDTVIFSGSFVHFNPTRSLPDPCTYALNTSDYFSLFHFSSIRKVESTP